MRRSEWEYFGEAPLEHEAALLFRSMHADLAMQVLRRLAALGPA